MLARELLKPDGVLIVTIGEHEIHHLGVLLEQVFHGYLTWLVIDGPYRNPPTRRERHGGVRDPAGGRTRCAR